MALKTTLYDPAEYLTDDETIAEYLTASFESNDPRIIAKALGAVARARGGMAELARRTGYSEDILVRALNGDESPELGTALKVIDALGVRLSASLVA